MPNENTRLRALYLGTTGDGVKVHSRFLAHCDVATTLALFKSERVPTDVAPFFIDLFDDNDCTIIETIGVSEETYHKVTGEPILSYSDYEREEDFHECTIFGAMQSVIRDNGVTIEENEHSKLFDAAFNLHKSRQSGDKLHQ
ncbi:hypothetical protein [Vibrio sp. Hal054]|uniref:hypothetical protein n=1 Tax=Vibrio sp. Hal054 TaxID=3035158 RepID=UPI00301D7767